MGPGRRSHHCIHYLPDQIMLTSQPTGNSMRFIEILEMIIKKIFFKKYEFLWVSWFYFCLFRNILIKERTGLRVCKLRKKIRDVEQNCDVNNFKKIDIYG